MLRAFGVTDKGRVRPANEDCFAIHEDLGLAVIADGMGGHNAGEVAARMAVDAIVDYYTKLAGQPPAAPASAASQSADEARRTTDAWPLGYDHALSPHGNRMRTAILIANVQILETAITTDNYAGMGTTVVAAHLAGDRLVVGHVGDSRLYLNAGGAFRLLTADDSWMAAVLANDPSADPVVLRHHPMRHALTNVVGARSRTDVHVIEEAVRAGDALLMTTDGVHEVLEDQRLEQLLRRGEDPEAAAHDIVTAALARGTRDNLTALVGRIA